jgi:hypothetical protein
MLLVTAIQYANVVFPSRGWVVDTKITFAPENVFLTEVDNVELTIPNELITFHGGSSGAWAFVNRNLLFYIPKRVLSCNESLVLEKIIDNRRKEKIPPHGATS